MDFDHDRPTGRRERTPSSAPLAGPSPTERGGGGRGPSESDSSEPAAGARPAISARMTAASCRVGPPVERVGLEGGGPDGAVAQDAAGDGAGGHGWWASGRTSPGHRTPRLN